MVATVKQQLAASTSLTPADPLKADFRNFLFAVWRHLQLPDPTLNQYDIATWLQFGPKRLITEAFRGVGKSWITVAFVCWTRELFSGAPESGIDGWVWRNDARASELEVIYNHKFNRLAPTLYDGAHQTMPGIVRYVTVDDGTVAPFELHPHQLNAVWRVVSSGNTLLDHAVGAGKTFAMIAAGMEQKRLGLIQRPMYVVPNHMLEQFSREFLQAYPRARILVADKAAMSRARRREFAARVAAERWDGIIITHDAFGRIRMSDRAYERFIRRELDELGAFRERAAVEEGKNSATVKELEKSAKRLEARLGDLLNKENKDDGVTFEELAVDFLFIDEAHAFKNLTFRTRHIRVKGLSARGASQRATDLFLKIRYLDDKRPGRSVVFATGTPVSNTIAEMYAMQRYLQMETLTAYGIDEFDAWAATFGEIVTQVELAPSGKGFRTTRSFSKFVNIPELMALYSRVADTQTADMLGLPRPRLTGGVIQIVEAGMSAREAAYMDALVARAEAIKGKRAEKGGDNMLKIMGEGLQLATDFRLLAPDAGANPDGKLAKAAANIARIWENGQEPGLAQIVFLDMGVPGSKARARQAATALDAAAPDDIVIIPAGFDEAGGDESDNALLASRFNLYAELRAELMAKGIPKAEIAFIHEADNDVKKGRLFAAVRAGEVRVLIGSTAKMGVGTNVQKRLIAMHHIDAPWRPADVEQRDGRILRQGNLNAEVAIYRYITLRSLDAYRWQTLNTKANFIAQLRAGARGMRTAEDIDSPLPEAAMIKAAATGDPRIMEHAELSRDVRLLEAARRAHERSLAAARQGLIATRDKIAWLTERVEKARADAGELIDLSGDRFAVTLAIGGESIMHRERRIAGEAIKAHLLQSGARHWGGAPAHEAIGVLSGLKIRARLRRHAGDLQLSVLADGRMSYGRGDYFALTEETDAVGLMRRFESLIKSIPPALAAQEDELAKAQADLPRLERQLLEPAFAKQDQFDAAKARLGALEAELEVNEQEGRKAMTQDRRDEEWARLDAATQQAVEAVIAEAAHSGAHAARDFENGDVYAYPHPGGGVAWGVNGGEHGFSVARGVKGGDGETVMATASEAADARTPNGEGTSYLDALRASHGDEAAFHRVFTNLAADGKVDTPVAAAIARAFTGEAGAWVSKDEALGAIETKFYDRARALEAQIEPGRTANLGGDGR